MRRTTYKEIVWTLTSNEAGINKIENGNILTIGGALHTPTAYIVATVNNGKREGDDFVHTFDVNGIRPVSEITLTLATDFYTDNTLILEANIEAGGFNNYNPIVWTVKNAGTTDAVITERMS